MSSFRLDGMVTGSSWKDRRVLAIGISLVMIGSMMSLVISDLPQVSISTLLQRANGAASPLLDLNATATPTPGYSNGNLAYLNETTPSVSTIESTNDTSPLTTRGCSGGPPIIESFEATPSLGEPPLKVSFSAETACGGAATWTWGDGNVSTQALPNGSVVSGIVTFEWWNYTHTFRYVGNFVAQFSVQSGSYKTSDSTNINVGTVGTVSFQALPSSGDPSLRVNFTYETFWGAGYSCAWTFGDGNSSRQASPNGTVAAGTMTYQWWNYSHTYKYVGDFFAQVNVSSTKFYASDSMSIYVGIVAAVSLQGTPNFGYPPVRTGFSYETEYGAGATASGTW